MLRFLSVLILLSASGCGCKHSDIQVTEVKRAGDWKLTCIQLEHGMSEAEYDFHSAERKMDNFEVYTPTPLCIADTYGTVVKASEAAKDRLQYLNMIYTQKKCGQSIEDKSIIKGIGSDSYVKIPTKSERIK